MEQQIKRVVDVLVTHNDKSLVSIMRRTYDVLGALDRLLNSCCDMSIAITRLTNSAREAIDANKNTTEG